jgi:hypothetical protein
LVTASFLHPSGGVALGDILRRAADHVVPGGHLLVVSHAVPPPWFGDAKHPDRAGRRFLSPMQQFAELGLDDHEWRVVTTDTRPRAAVDSSGEQVELTDGILLIRRAPAGLHHGDFSSR